MKEGGGTGPARGLGMLAIVCTVRVRGAQLRLAFTLEVAVRSKLPPDTLAATGAGEAATPKKEVAASTTAGTRRARLCDITAAPRLD